MDYIQITKENIDKEHICCAMSGKQSLAKKEWLKQRFAEGLVFYRSVERGKCFIEYIPAENAWVPITADGWLYINCLWVSGSMKGHGCSNDLLEKCLSDARAQQHNIPFRAIHITDKEAAQNVSAPVTTYALFRDGVFLTQGIQSDKKFLALAGVQNGQLDDLPV